MDKITYIKDDKEFIIKKHPKRKIKSWFAIVLYGFFIMLFLLSTFIITKTIFKTNEKNKITYTEKGVANYKVYLKDNDYYEEKYLDNKSRIIANLINTISIDFNYDIKAKEKLNYDYNYKIVGELLIYDKQDTNKPVHKKTYELDKDEIKENNQTNININKDIVIDYDEYNKYFNSFKSTYGINSIGELVVKMIITTDTYKTEKNTTVNELSVSIPLSEQTIDIKLNANNFEKTNEINVTTKSKATVFEIISLCLTIVILITLIVRLVMYLIKLYNQKNNPYERALKKILREYDSIIVNATSSFVEKKDKVIRVEDFKEMLDAQKVHNVPILFYEVEKGNKAYFVIKDNETVYRYTLTKAYQIKNKK